MLKGGNILVFELLQVQEWRRLLFLFRLALLLLLVLLSLQLLLVVLSVNVAAGTFVAACTCHFGLVIGLLRSCGARLLLLLSLYWLLLELLLLLLLGVLLPRRVVVASGVFRVGGLSALAGGGISVLLHDGQRVDRIPVGLPAFNQWYVRVPTEALAGLGVWIGGIFAIFQAEVLELELLLLLVLASAITAIVA